jgi:hypothetical protein
VLNAPNDAAVRGPREERGAWPRKVIGGIKRRDFAVSAKLPGSNWTRCRSKISAARHTCDQRFSALEVSRDRFCFGNHQERVNLEAKSVIRNLSATGLHRVDQSDRISSTRKSPAQPRAWQSFVP